SSEPAGPVPRTEPARRAHALQEAAGNHAAAALHTGEAALTRRARATLERAYGTDFGSVRVHGGPDAEAKAAAEHAVAFTRGSDVYLGAAAEGDPEVLAHELAHVVQQSAPTAETLPSYVLEGEAERSEMVTAGSAIPGSVQKLKLPWEEEEERK